MIVLIEPRPLIRGLLALDIGRRFDARVLEYPDAASWVSASSNVLPCLVVLCCIGEVDPKHCCREVSSIVNAGGAAPIVVMADFQDLAPIREVVERGARGYIPSSASPNVAEEAMRLVRVGGVFAPAERLLAAREAIEVDNTETVPKPNESSLTSRELEVATLVRHGKMNKLIARELNMRESTVKVHVRSIMRKFQVKNRTEVALKVGGLL